MSTGHHGDKDGEQVASTATSIHSCERCDAITGILFVFVFGGATANALRRILGKTVKNVTVGADIIMHMLRIVASIGNVLFCLSCFLYYCTCVCVWV